jgi:superfamily I DNA and/or RNA helicase
MMERLTNLSSMPVHRLDVNYRCPQNVYEVANDECYEGAVKTETNRTLLVMEGVNLSHETFINVPSRTDADEEEMYRCADGKMGYCNSKETAVVIQCLEMLNEKPGINIRDDALVVAPYVSHVQQLIENFAKIATLKDVKVSTLDSIQGHEKKIIIAAFTRTKGVGFLKDSGRINVLSTRAMECVIYVGDHCNLLTCEPDTLLHKMMTRATDKLLIKSLSECIFLPLTKRLLSEVQYNCPHAT